MYVVSGYFGGVKYSRTETNHMKTTKKFTPRKLPAIRYFHCDLSQSALAYHTGRMETRCCLFLWLGHCIHVHGLNCAMNLHSTTSPDYHVYIV